MAKPVKNFEVVLTYDSESESWGIARGKGRPVAPEQFPAITVPYGHSGQITFSIEGSAGVTFDPTNPILAAKVTNPPSKPTTLDPQFAVVPSNDPTKLIVTDLNGIPGKPQKGYDKTDYNYVLNFVNAKQLDPIISNSGCCKPTGAMDFFRSTEGMMTIAILFVVVIATLLLRRRKMRVPNSSSA